MVTLNFAFLQPKADLGANILVTVLGTKSIPLLLDNSKLPDDKFRIR